MVKALTSAERLDIAPFSHELRSQLLNALTDEQVAMGMHIVLPTGEIHTGPDASVRLLGVIAPPLRRFTSADSGGSSVQALVRSGYRTISTNRGRLARFSPAIEPVTRITE